MPEITVVTRSGEQKSIPFTPGMSLMQAITEGGIYELQALCGGVCSCATCHVHIDADFKERVGDASEDEDGLLSGSEHRCQASRLSCQISLTGDMEGLRITIAPEDE
ncbi:MAG: 2Fe-2S iron-sulfur cluster binding domain-containing protein [Halioglobus sp.]|nr:2Fe-2S iron-sulfur cluster binding domain-containing protein [Halioglobus sp.]